jgi:hypothetical protein
MKNTIFCVVTPCSSVEVLWNVDELHNTTAQKIMLFSITNELPGSINGEEFPNEKSDYSLLRSPLLHGVT